MQKPRSHGWVSIMRRRKKKGTSWMPSGPFLAASLALGCLLVPPVCLPQWINPSSNPSIHDCINPSIHRSINPSNNLSINYPSITPSIHQSINQSTNPSIHQSINSSNNNPSINQSTNQSSFNFPVQSFLMKFVWGLKLGSFDICIVKNDFLE